MRKWARKCPENFLHMHLLIEAELCRIKDNKDHAATLYDQAIQSAHDNQFIQHEALANELAGRFQLGKGHEDAARRYLIEARSCYAKWGADGKVKALEEQYPEFLKKSSPARPASATTRGNIAEIDMASVIKASQAISGSFDLDKLLNNLMRIVIQHAGAQRGALIMEKTGRLQVVAESSASSEEISVQEYIPAESSERWPGSLVNYAMRTGEVVIVNDATHSADFSDDPYVVKNRSLSLMCMPLVLPGKRASILYLENSLIPHAFTSERIAVLNLLSNQIAISLENALLYKEKDEILRCLHDSLSADMHNIFLLSEMGSTVADADGLSRKLSLIAETSKNGLQTIRDFLFLSAKECLPVQEFTALVNDYGRGLLENAGIEFLLTMNVPDSRCSLPPILAFNLHLICKEALTNVLKHAGARKVSASVSQRAGRLELSITDDGKGFEPERQTPRGNGLNNMRARAREIGADISIESAAGTGAAIRLTMPLSRATSAY